MLSFAKGVLTDSTTRSILSWGSLMEALSPNRALASFSANTKALTMAQGQNQGAARCWPCSKHCTHASSSTLLDSGDPSLQVSQSTCTQGLNSRGKNSRFSPGEMNQLCCLLWMWKITALKRRAAGTFRAARHDNSVTITPKTLLLAAFPRDFCKAKRPVELLEVLAMNYW